MLPFNSRGFTLAELIVSIFVISLLSAAFIADYHSARRFGELNIAAQKLASDIRMAQNYTLGLNKFNGNIPDGGWGINIRSGNNNYIVFADTDGDKIFDSLSEQYKVINLINGLTISNIECFFGLGTFSIISPLDIMFVPPNPFTDLVILNNNGNNIWANQLDYCKITITNPEGNSKSILINKFGLIDVED